MRYISKAIHFKYGKLSPCLGGLFHPALTVPMCRKFTPAKAQFSTTSLVHSNDVELTSVRYPEVKRDPSFAKLTPADVEHFKDILDTHRVITDPDDVEGRYILKII